MEGDEEPINPPKGETQEEKKEGKDPVQLEACPDPSDWKRRFTVVFNASVVAFLGPISTTVYNPSNHLPSFSPPVIPILPSFIPLFLPPFSTSYPYSGG